MALTRKQFFTRVLIGAACTGALLTTFTEKGSGPYQFGALLGLVSLTIGSFVVFYFAKKRAPLVSAPPDFAPDEPFEPHVRLQLAGLRAGDGGAPAALPALADRRYYLLIGTEGFSVRLRSVAADPAAPGGFDAQFLRPEVSVPRFAEGTTFRVFDGANVVAEGAVAKQLATA